MGLGSSRLWECGALRISGACPSRQRGSLSMRGLPQADRASSDALFPVYVLALRRLWPPEALDRLQPAELQGDAVARGDASRVRRSIEAEPLQEQVVAKYGRDVRKDDVLLQGRADCRARFGVVE